MAGGNWDPTALPIAPGIYINFVQRAAAAINGGERGTVALGLTTYTGGTAVAKTIYTVEREIEAIDLFGVANIDPIRLAFAGGAAKVAVYTLPASPVTADYADMRNAFDSFDFNVFAFDKADAIEQSSFKTWVIQSREDGKHFMLVIGGSSTDDATPATGNARSILNADDYIVNETIGGVYGTTVLSSAQSTVHTAGSIAGARINESVTYAATAFSNVNKRLSNSERDAALEDGSLILMHDGKRVKIVQGITTSKKKIRAIRARQAVATDITEAATESYIGKLQNNADGQATLIAAIMRYMETLEANSVLADPVVELDPLYPSVDDKVFLRVSYREIDSMERIFFTINV